MPKHDHRTCHLCSLQRHPARAKDAAVVRRLLVHQAPAGRREQQGGQA